MREWIFGTVVLLGVLGVGYFHALPVAGSLYRRARAALYTWRYRRQIVRLLRQPGVRILAKR